MKADLSLRHDVFEPYFPPMTRDADMRALGHALLALAKRIWAGLATALEPVSFEEAYLAKAQNHADLERRMFDLQYGRHDLTRW